MKTKLLIGFMAFLSFSSCGGEDPSSQNASTQQRGMPSGPYSYRQFSWETSGGGNLRYTIVPDATTGGSFTITITSYNFKSSTQRIIVSAGSPIYTILQDLFYGRITIQALPPTDRLTGTWNKIIIIEISGNQREIRSPDLNASQAQPIQQINDYVRQQAEGGNNPIDDGGRFGPTQTCMGIQSIAGTWRSTQSNGSQTTSEIKDHPCYSQGHCGTYREKFYYGYDRTLDSRGNVISNRMMDYEYSPQNCTIYERDQETARGRSYKIVSVNGNGGRRAITVQACRTNLCDQPAPQSQPIVLQEQ